MTAHLTPATVKREEYGSIVGRVLSVGAAPSTAAGMMAVLDNRELVTSLTQAGPQLAVGVELEPDTSAASGYRWSSGRGPAITIGSGTLATGEFVVRREPPIALVIPALKKFLGLD
jgi:HlyD family secretion protein